MGYIIATLISLITFYIGIRFERYRSKKKLESLEKSEKEKEFNLFNSRLEYLKNWDNMYRDFEKSKRVIDSSFNNGHFTTCRKYIIAFREKYWDRFVSQDAKFNDVRREKMDTAMDLYRKLDEYYLDHFGDVNKTRVAEGKWKQKLREERLEDLLDK